MNDEEGQRKGKHKKGQPQDRFDDSLSD